MARARNGTLDCLKIELRALEPVFKARMFAEVEA